MLLGPGAKKAAAATMHCILITGRFLEEGGGQPGPLKWFCKIRSKNEHCFGYENELRQNENVYIGIRIGRVNIGGIINSIMISFQIWVELLSCFKIWVELLTSL